MAKDCRIGWLVLWHHAHNSGFCSVCHYFYASLEIEVCQVSSSARHIFHSIAPFTCFQVSHWLDLCTRPHTHTHSHRGQVWLPLSRRAMPHTFHGPAEIEIDYIPLCAAAQDSSRLMGKYYVGIVIVAHEPPALTADVKTNFHNRETLRTHTYHRAIDVDRRCEMERIYQLREKKIAAHS